MEYFIVLVAAFFAAISYVRAANRIKKGAVSLSAGLLIVLAFIAIAETITLLPPTPSLIVALLVTIVLAGAQLFTNDKSQIKTIIGLSAVIGIAAAMTKAEKFDTSDTINRVLTEGLEVVFESIFESIIKPIIMAFVVPILFVAILGLIRWLCIEGYLSGLFELANKITKKSDIEDEEDDENDSDEEESSSGSSVLGTLMPLIIIAALLLVCVIGTILYVKGGA